MDKEITYHSKDVLLKFLSGVYKDTALDVYQLRYPKIKDVLPNNFPRVKADERRADTIFLLEDDSVLLLEYESNARFEENHLKYADYILQVANHYYKEEKVIKKIHVAVLYASNVTTVPNSLDLGSMYIETQSVLFRKFDGDIIFQRIHNKIQSGNELEKQDIMELILVPLMRSSKEQQQVIKDSIELAKEIKNEFTQIGVIAGILTATDKIIDEDFSKSVREWLQMTKVERIYEQEKEQAVQEAMKNTAKVLSLASSGKKVEQIAKELNMPEERVEYIIRMAKVN